MLNEPFEKYVEEYLNWSTVMRNHSRNTVIDKGYRLRQFAKVANVTIMSDITNDSIDYFIFQMRQRTYLGKPISSNTINKRIETLTVFLKWVRDMYGMKLQVNFVRIPVLRDDPTKEKVFYSRDEINRVLPFADIQIKLAIAIAFDSSARLSELLNIRIDDIDDRTIKIIGKGRKRGYLVMTNATRKLLEDYIREYDIVDYLFPSTRLKTRPMVKNTMRLKMQKAFKLAGFDDFYPHALRHSSATEFQRLNASVDEIRAFLRHSDTRTTQIYLHNLDGANVELYDKYRVPLAL